MSSSIRVALRIRPDLDEEDAAEGLSGDSNKNCLHVDSNTVSIRKHKKDGNSEISHQYTFDRVFDEDATQEEVFTNVVDLIEEGLKGFNATIFAFGMTGSGKTHTISGLDTDSGHAGIVPRAVHHVFSNLRGYSKENKNNVAMVFLTFVELYNNTFYDLLASQLGGDESASGKKDSRSHDAFGSSSVGGASSAGGLKLQEHPGRGMTLIGSSTLRVPVTSAEETLALIEKGYKLRATASTNLNERSSRSHTVLSMEVLTRGDAEVDGDSSASSGRAVTKIGKINLVDLAGSERVKVSGATGQTLTEAKQINKALSVLGDVLNALSKRDEHHDDTRSTSKATPFAHVPYRNSKLTMLLKDSLGGNAKTMMIATVRQKAAFYQQTLTSLQYAARARHIKCNPILNIADAQGDDGSEAGGASMQKTLNEVTRLKLQLELRTAEFDELKKRLQQAEEDKRRTVSQAMKKSAARGALDAAVSAETKARDAKITEYREMIDTLKRNSEAERKELQSAMKFVIHNHEGHLAMKEKEFVSLEEKLQAEVTRAEALMRDKADALQSKREVDSRNEALYQENVDLTRLVERLKMEVVTLKRALAQAEDRAAVVAMSQADRDQFVEALQKLTASRAKHKERADAAEEQMLVLTRQWEESRGAADTLTVQLSKLGGKLLELEEKKEAYKRKTVEQDALISAAVVRIKTLEGAPSSPTSPKGIAASLSSASTGAQAQAQAQTLPDAAAAAATAAQGRGTTGVDASIGARDKVVTDTAAASATAIVVSVTETAAEEVSQLTTLYEAKCTELRLYREEVTGVVEESRRVLAERDAVKVEMESRVQALTQQLTSVKAELQTRSAALHKAEEAKIEADQDRSAANISLESLQRQQTDLKEALKNAQDSHLLSQQLVDSLRGELEAAQTCNEEHEGRIRELVLASAQAMKDLKAERGTHSSELEVMRQLHESLKATNIALETQLANSQSQVQELTERFDGREEAKDQDQDQEGATPKESEPRPQTQVEGEGEGEEVPSPTSENRQLKSAISALKQQEKVMFFALEDKLRDLDAARNKLVMLKNQSERQKSDDLLRRLRSEVDSDDEDRTKGSTASSGKNTILERMLQQAQQGQEKAQVKLLSSQHQIKELQIRLDSTASLLEQERQTNRDLAEELEDRREEAEREIERLSAMVKKTIADSQLRRSHELDRGLESPDTSLDTALSQSPDNNKGISIASPSPHKNPGAAVTPLGAIPEHRRRAEAAAVAQGAGGDASDGDGDGDGDGEDSEDLDYFDVADEPGWLDVGADSD